MINHTTNLNPPEMLTHIERETKALGFKMASEPQTGSLLRTLAASKPEGKFLELGTGTGLSACWILEGMDQNSTLVTVENDKSVLTVARQYLETDDRISIHLSDGESFIDGLRGQTFDFIFADTWPGKFNHLDETLALLAPGGFYIIDDLLPQPAWPKGHAPKVPKLIAMLEERSDLCLTKFNWATGILVASKKANA